jgi:hypothetical protein
MKNAPSHLLAFALALSLACALLATPAGAAPATSFTQARPSGSADPWWDSAWPYRIPVTASGSGVVSAGIDFSVAFAALGLNHALLDLRSIRVVPYSAGSPAAPATPGAPLPYAETYSAMLNDGESTAGWSTNDLGSVALDTQRRTRGAASVRTIVTNTTGGYGYPGVELHPGTIHDWSRYEVLLYDVWPEVNASALDQAPDLYWFKLYNACGGSSVTQGGPPLALDRWNYASVSLSPLDNCWPPRLNLSNITRMEFHTRDNVDGDTSGPNGWWNDGDVLRLWFDNMRLVDQENGSIRWQSEPGVSLYYIYFDTLTHEGHPQPALDPSLGAATLNGDASEPEAGGYYHPVDGMSVPGGLRIWSAPAEENVLKGMAVPVAGAPLRISAARGEFEPFQLVAQSAAAQSAPVSISPFVKGSDVITNVTLHRVDYVTITTAGDQYDRFGPWPDPLWPLDLGEAVDLPAGENQPLWFTVHVPWDAAPGVYQATVSIGSASVPVSLQVWDFALPREIHLQSEWGFDWSSLVEDVYQGTSDWTCYWKVVDAFKQDFADHRMIPKGVAWPAGLNYPGGVEYNCDTGVLSPDAWGVWGFGFLGGKYVHGQAGFNGGYGFPSFLALGPRDNWPPDSLPYSFCGVTRSGVLGSAEYQAKWTQYLGALDQYINSANYAGAAYYHIVNEPQSLADYAIVGQISALTASAAPHLHQLLSEQVEPAIYNYPGAKINIWMPTISNYEPAKSHDRQKNHGESVWWYYLYGDDPPLPNPILMSHPGIEARITPWLAWAERVDGLLHYSTTDWSLNPWTTPNVTGMDNGDGFFFYPPRQDNAPLAACGANGNRLVPSLRWENLRDGMEDYEYLWLLAGGTPAVDATNAADAFVDQVVQSRTRFSHVPTDLAAARAALAAAIVARLGGPGVSMRVEPAAVAPGEWLTYSLSYRHAGMDTTLRVTDSVPALVTVQGAFGPGTILVDGQTVLWSVPVSAGVTVTLHIRARAGETRGPAHNTAVFASEVWPEGQVAQADALVYWERIFLPVIFQNA